MNLHLHYMFIFEDKEWDDLLVDLTRPPLPDRAEPGGTTLKLGNRSQISPRRVTRVYLPGQLRNESILEISV